MRLLKNNIQNQALYVNKSFIRAFFFKRDGTRKHKRRLFFLTSRTDALKLFYIKI